MHACMYVCVYVLCMHVCMYVCMYACIYVCVCVCIMHACMYVCVCLYVCKHACMCVCMYVRMYVHVCVFARTDDCTYTGLRMFVFMCLGPHNSLLQQLQRVNCTLDTNFVFKCCLSYRKVTFCQRSTNRRDGLEQQSKKTRSYSTQGPIKM
jgi:hypothetical protein